MVQVEQWALGRGRKGERFAPAVKDVRWGD